MQAGPVTGVRSGRHACFDRLVVDLKGKAPGYTVSYVSQITAGRVRRSHPDPRRRQAAGDRERPRLHPDRDRQLHPAEPARGRQRHRLLDVPPGRLGRPFEGYTSMGLGVRARLPFRVFTIQDATTSRLVIDVAHRW